VIKSKQDIRNFTPQFKDDDLDAKRLVFKELLSPSENRMQVWTGLYDSYEVAIHKITAKKSFDTLKGLKDEVALIKYI
jgi:hypothetical protein